MAGSEGEASNNAVKKKTWEILEIFRDRNKIWSQIETGP